MDMVPRQAYTMGIKTIMQAKKIVVIANGIEKAKIVNGVPSQKSCPAQP